MKKALKIIGIVTLILIICRGFIFRSTIHYTDIGNRKEIKITNLDLIASINKASQNKSIDIYTIAEIANDITTQQLQFTTGKASNNPNKLINTKQANCVGYAAMFNSIANYLIKENGLQNEIKAYHKIGKLDFLGIDLHQFFDSPFFRDHDFNELSNNITKESIIIDPSVSDYLYINRVTKKQ